VIGLAAALALVAAFTGEPSKGILIAEWSAIWAFGASWFATVELDLLLNRDSSRASAAAG
jgi:hypothetical protein